MIALFGPAAGTTGHPLMLQVAAELILPFAVLRSIFLFLRGHNLPAAASYRRAGAGASVVPAGGRAWPDLGRRAPAQIHH